MICKNCRTEVEDNSKMCPKCGSVIENEKDTEIDDYSKLANASTNKELLDNINSSDNNGEKKEYNNKFFTIVVVAITIIIFGIAILRFFPSKKSSSNGSSNSNIDSNSNSNIESDSNSNQTSNSNSNNGIADDKITFKGYIVQIPNIYTISSNADTLQLIGKNNKDIAVINISSGNYDSIKASPKALEEYVKNRQIVCNNIKTTVYNGAEFTTAEIISNGTNMILGYSKVDDSHVFEIVISNVSHTIDYSQFDIFAEVVKTLKLA